MKKFIAFFSIIALCACTNIQVKKVTDALVISYQALEILEQQYDDGVFGTPDATAVGVIKANDLIIKNTLDALIQEEISGTKPTAAQTAVLAISIANLENYINSKETK